MIDYWCNAFTPDRAASWRAVIEAEGLALRTRDGSDDDFAEPDAMVDRMDRLGVRTLVLPVCELDPDAPLTDFAHYAVRPGEIEQLHQHHPGRFVGMYSVDPTDLETDLDAARSALGSPWCVALHTHTHSWDRPFDHPDYAAYYLLCAEHGVPFVMQAGASGGNFAHQAGHPGAIAAPAQHFASVDFVLSHTGAPWVAETIEMASTHPNVQVGTATHPPRRWPDELVEFIRGPGRTKTLFGTGFPLTGHTRSLAQLAELDLPAAVAEDLLIDNARRIFGRIPGG
ncbi:MAG: amidohydrolase family protein [Acidimicrobiia bacterium]|nr:amidohydrolase family protein [Acidimicrobiia bacterium]